MTSHSLRFNPIYRERPGAHALAPAAAEHAEEITPGLWCSPSLSNSCLLITTQRRVIVHTGMGFESVFQRADFDEVDDAPIRSELARKIGDSS